MFIFFPETTASTVRVKLCRILQISLILLQTETPCEHSVLRHLS